MFLLTWQEIGEAIVDALLWFLAGILGTLQTVVRVRTDVPWYQCLISQLIVLAVAVPLVILGEKRRRNKEFRQRCKRGDL